MDDILPHWFKALNFDDTEIAEFQAALQRFRDLHKTALEGSPSVAKDASENAQKVYQQKLLPKMKAGGSPQNGVLLSAGVSIVNLVCLILVWETMPEKYHPGTWSARNWADLTGAGANLGLGICATLTRANVNLGAMSKWAENASVSLGLGTVLSIITVAEGIMTIVDGALKDDFWMIASGTLQIGSGALIFFGMLTMTPGAQLVGVILGLAATALSLIEDAVQDKMLQFLSQLLEPIKNAVSAYDGKTALVDSLGLRSLIAQLESLISSCKVTELAYNANWVEHHKPIAKIKAHDRLILLGISDWEQRGKLLREVWAS